MHTLNAIQTKFATKQVFHQISNNQNNLFIELITNNILSSSFEEVTVHRSRLTRPR